MTKPPYRVPLMTEIAAIPWNGFNAASTFSGCGGSSLGYRMAGFRVLWANEFIPAAQDSYRANAAPYTHLDTRDIRQVQPHEILEQIGLKPGELDLFDGSPPCASFSTAGKREAGWGKVKKYSDSEQRTDDLFFEFARLLRGLQPKTFVAENVSGLVKGTAKGYFLEILRELKSCGYNVACKVLDAQWLGVPQARQRTIFIGVRNDLGLMPAHPSPLPYRYSVSDSINNLPLPTSEESRLITSGTNTRKFWEQTVVGQNFSQAAEAATGKESYFNMVKVDPLLPSPTITATHQQFHWKEPRYLSLAEVKRICGFPDDFHLKGNFSQKWERCGRSVPPVMMSHIATTVRDQILKKLCAE